MSNSAVRGKQTQHRLHQGHCQLSRRRKGSWASTNRPTITARKQQQTMLRVGNNHAAHNKSALQWAQSIYSHCTATAKQKATALQILIENWFRQITGPHANLLSIMCILLMIAFTLVHSFRPVPINSPIVHLRQQADVLHQSLDREQSQLPQCTAHIGHLTTTVASSNGENTQLAADQQLLELRNAHWDLVAEANVSGDHKEYSKSAAWRASITSIHSALLHDCTSFR